MNKFRTLQYACLCYIEMYVFTSKACACFALIVRAKLVRLCVGASKLGSGCCVYIGTY